MPTLAREDSASLRWIKTVAFLNRSRSDLKRDSFSVSADAPVLSENYIRPGFAS